MSAREKIKSKRDLTTKKHDSLSKSVVKSVIESMYQTGLITDEDFRDGETFRSKILSLTKKSHFGFVVDHRTDIIDIARQYKKEKNYDYATLFYAIFFEHTINSIIDRVCTRNKMNKKIINEIIKNVSIDGKLNWLPTLLKIPNINIVHKGLIKKNAEDRNSFIHYKFNAGDDDVKVEIQKRNNRLEVLDKLEKTVTYIKKYESRILYGNRKGNFHKNFKKYH